MDRATYNWSEFIPPGGQEQTALSATTDSMQKTMMIKVNQRDLNTALLHILGYAQVTNGNLNRITPAKHPGYPWLRATRIINSQGRLGNKSVAGDIAPNSGTVYQRTVFNRQNIPGSFVSVPNTPLQGQTPLQSGRYGTYGSWDQCLVSIMFESPQYPILEDDQVAFNGNFNGIVYNNYRAEHLRYVLKNYDTNIECISRRGEIWKWINQNVGGPGLNYPTGFAGDLILKQAKGVLTWTWVDVPEDFIMLGKLIPMNLLAATGKVNRYPFPWVSFTDQNQPTNNDGTANYVQFPPGTLLMLPIKTKPRSQTNPQVTSPVIQQNPYAYPRTYDIFFTMIHFDPPTNETMYVFPGAEVLNPQVPKDVVQVRGHNLAPTPTPLRLTGPPLSPQPGRWWAPGRVSSQGANFVLSSYVQYPNTSRDYGDQLLLYQYYDFEKCFQQVTSTGF